MSKWCSHTKELKNFILKCVYGAQTLLIQMVFFEVPDLLVLVLTGLAWDQVTIELIISHSPRFTNHMGSLHGKYAHVKYNYQFPDLPPSCDISVKLIIAKSTCTQYYPGQIPLLLVPCPIGHTHTHLYVICMHACIHT